MVQKISRFKWVGVALPLLVAVVLFHSSILAFLTGGTQSSQEQGTPTPITLTSPSTRPTVVQFCADTPPLYSSNLAHDAAVSLADKIDATVTFHTQGLIFFSSFLTAHSYQNTAVSFSVPAVAALPSMPPVPVYPSDPYKAATMKHDYQKSVATWQQTVNIMQAELHTLQAHIHEETNKLRTLHFPYDATGSDVLGCLADAAANMQGVKGVKWLLIASDLVNTTSEKDTGSLSLSGIGVRAIYHTCVGTPNDCQGRDSFWKQFLLHAGAASVQFFTPAQSTALQETF